MDTDKIIQQMLMTKYVAGGRGPNEYDCWGLLMRVCELMGWPVPRDPKDFGSNPREIINLFRLEVSTSEWEKCNPVDGAVCFFGTMRTCVHAGIVVNGGVLHTEAPRYGKNGGPRWQPLEDITWMKKEFAQWAK